MHRIDTAGSASGRFVDADDVSGVRGADVDAAVLNAWQNPICDFIEREGIALTKGRDADLLDALKHAYGSKTAAALAQDGVSVEVVNTTTPGEIVRFTVPGGTVSGGRRLRIRAFGERSAGTAVTFAARFGGPSSPAVAVTNGAVLYPTLAWRLDPEIAAVSDSEAVIIMRLKIEGANTYSEIAAGYSADLTDDLDVIVTAALATAAPSVWAKRHHYSAELIR